MKHRHEIIVTLLAGCVFAGSAFATASTTAPATAPTTAPAPAPAGSFSIGVDRITPPMITVSSAPVTVHVSAIGLATQPADWLNETYRWNFGDVTGATQPAIDPRTQQPVDLNTAIAAPVAAYLYESPGVYAITLTRITAAGEIRTYACSITVPVPKRNVYYIASTGDDSASGVDPTRALRTAAAAVRRVADHTELRFQRGGVFAIDHAIDLTHRDVVLDCYGDPSLPLPVIYRVAAASPATTQTTQATQPATMTTTSPTAGPFVNTWPGKTADVTIRHLRFDSPYAIAHAGAYLYHTPAAYFGFLRGKNVTIADCEFANVFEGPHGDQTLSGALFLRNRQVQVLGIPGRTLWLEGSDIVAIGNIATNSINESPIRAADTGVVRGVIAFNDIAQQLDAIEGRGGAKAAMTLRSLRDVQVCANHIANGELSFDPHTGDAFDQNVLTADNVIHNSVLRVRPNCRSAIFRNNAIDIAGGPCICVTNGDGVAMWNADVRIEDNRGQGWQSNGRMFLIDPCPPAAMRNCSMDAGKNAYTRIAPPPPPVAP
ncbi:MAG TPA: PKD domain-containing protein, partial [Tepidisphaeraceae bacterium]|nr:PKD domain-containing protein [Tepidisphaeraceae bacterium]